MAFARMALRMVLLLGVAFFPGMGLPGVRLPAVVI
jgi:hypothetical protein